MWYTEGKRGKGGLIMKWKHRILLAGIFLLLPGCAGQDGAVEPGIARDEAIVQEGEGGNALPADVLFQEKLLLHRGYLQLYTADYEEAEDEILAVAEGYGGFLQESSVRYGDPGDRPSGTYLLRIPGEGFQDAMAELSKAGTLAGSSQSVENITASYEDTEGRLEALEIQEEQLKGYLRAAGSIEELLAVEKELARIRTEMDQALSQLKNWDRELAFATIQVSLTEDPLGASVISSPLGRLPEESREAFIASVNFLLNGGSFLVVTLFRLLPFTLPAALGVGIWQGWKRRKKKGEGPGKDRKE